MDDVCRTCGAKCCRYFCFEIDEPEDFDEFEDVRWFLCHEGVSVHVDDGDWFISIDNPCKMLTEDNQCGIYEDRPLICRKYDTETCDLTSGDYGYDEEFKTPEDIDRYARKVLGPEGWDRARRREREKLDRKMRKKTGKSILAAKNKKNKKGGKKSAAR